jgi:hypothetical protein
MKRTLFIILFALSLTSSLTQPCAAQQWPWRPSDFAPMTELPWTEEGTPLPKVIATIYRDPRPGVRYAVLAEYLRHIPLPGFNEAFTLCTEFEGTQDPGLVVHLILSIWAQRDPEAAWKKAMELLELSVVQGEPSGLERWDGPKLVVANAKALRASKFYLNADCATGFLDGIEERWKRGIKDNTPTRARRIEMLKAFYQRYVEICAAPPPRLAERNDPALYDPYQIRHPEMVIEMFKCKTADLPGKLVATGTSIEAAEVAAGRWLAAQPAKATKIIDALYSKKAKILPLGPPMGAEEHEWLRWVNATSFWFVPLWKRVDQPGMLKWIEAQTKGSDLLYAAHGVMMSETDAETRKRWIKRVDVHDTPPDHLPYLLVYHWAVWNPDDALKAINVSHDESAVTAVFESLYSEDATPWNLSPWRIKFAAELEWEKHPFMVRQILGSVDMMEQWIHVDVGAAARLAFKAITAPEAQEQFPRAKLIEGFAGAETFSTDRDALDEQCFGALRFWAMWKPDEMRAWITTVQGEDMRTALTWLLEHPWGAGADPK